MASPVRDLVNGVTHLVSQNASNEQLVWFLSLWESAWNRVPAASKRVIEKYWREGLAPESCRRKPNAKERYDPHVCLYKETQYDENASPGITLEGHVISFPTQFMEGLRRDHAVVAIAHELAHVSFYAEAEPNHWPNSKNPTAYNTAERLVDARLLVWGFTQEELDGLDALLGRRGISRFLPE